jgi:uncharacterized membrane protein
VAGDSGAAARRGGVGFVGLLAVAFIVLKLCGVIGWPWIWVLAPLWVGCILWVAAVVVTVVVLAAAVRARERAEQDPAVRARRTITDLQRSAVRNRTRRTHR